MKNILNEKPNYTLTGRLLESMNFVQDEDVKDKVVLNIGCGFGWCELNFLERGVKQITGTEIADEDLKAARENITDPRASFIIGDATKLPTGDQSVDTVVSWEVIEHIPENTEMKMFSEVNRVLKPDGVFYLSTPFRHPVSNVMDPAWWLIKHRHYSKAMLTSFAEKNNLEVIEFRVRGKFWSLFSLTNLYFSKWVLRREPLFHDFVSNKQNEEYRQGEGYATIFAKFKKKAV